MSENIWIEIIKDAFTFLGTILTVILTASKTRKEEKKRIDKLETKVDEHIEDNQCTNAKQTRIRILRFYDEICEGKKHSENHYEDILEDIDYYEKFCTAHKDFRNNKGQIAMAGIKSTYAALKKENKFLKEIGK